MCDQSHAELSSSMYERARQFCLTRPWGTNINPLTLTRIFDSLPSNNESSVKSSTVVAVGSRITLLDLQENEYCTLTMVNPQDSDPTRGDISFLSPLGAALINKAVGQSVAISVLGSTMRYKIIDTR